MTANMEKPIKRIVINVLFITRGTLRKPPILIIFSAYIFVNLYRIIYFASQFTTLKTAADGNSRINVHGIGRFHRFQLNELHLPYGEVEDLREGKSCIYKYSLTIWTRYFETSNPWICQQCHRGRCKRLKRRGRCHAFHKHVTDQTPRVSTRYSPFTREKSATATFYHDGHGSYANHNIPICGATLTRPCFNLTKCNKSEPLKIFSYGGNTDPQLDFATKQQPDVIQKVENADEACLLVVGLNAFQSLDDLIQSEHWNNGENHYIYQSSIMFGSHGDRPFNDKTINDRNINFGLAAMSPWSSDDAYIREGFDTPVGLYPRWKKEEIYNNLDLHRSRRYLVSFKGNIYPDEQRSWQHRWIASEYWDNDDDVHIDTTCEYSRNFFGALRVHNKYDNPDDSDYEQLLLNSTFFFCPGGGGTNSFRFPEALQGGAIPVVTGDFLPPFHPEVDWSGCIVRVSEARVVDLPRILREISEDEIHLRQLKCSALLDSIFGKPIDSRQHFAVAMQLWNIRIKNALQRIEDLSGLTR